MTTSASERRPAEHRADWCAPFDHLSPVVAEHLHEVLEHMRTEHPVAWSDKWGGFWLVSRYDDVLEVAQNWRAFSSAHGVTVPYRPSEIPALPEMVDPPVHREYKRLINAYFTPAAVLEHEATTRELINDLIDRFIEHGACEFMSQFARPLPGLVFFESFLHAPASELAEVNRLATLASVPTSQGAMAARGEILEWIKELVAGRRAGEPLGDVVDAVINTEIDGRPITDDEILGVIQLLIFGGLDTTAGALGHMMVRLCREPEIADRLRADLDLVPDAVEELLRLDGPFAFIARTAMADVEIGGQPVKSGDKVLIAWVSANRDAAEFECPAEFDPGRQSNRHVAFGAGPHRCAGSNLARMNLRISLRELIRRLDDLRLQDGAEPISYHSAFSRSPNAVPINFTPGPRVG